MADKTVQDVYEEDPLALARAYGAEPVDPDETVKAAKDVGQFALESLPGVGTAFTVAEIEDELKKEEPNYVKIGMLVGTEAIGLIPGLGTAAKNMIRKGADMARQTDEAIEVTSSIPKVSRKVDREADAAEAARLRNDPGALEQWRKENKLPETQRQKNLPDAQAAAQSLIEGKITSKEARNRIKEAFPESKEYTAEEVMNLLPTLTEVQGALGKKGTRYPILGVEGADLAEGQVVSSRLDIPAYDDYDKWVVSIHDGNQKSGSVVGYGQAIRLKNIRFGSDADTALDIARGTRTSKATGQDAIDKKTGEPAKQNKATIARIFGEYTSEDPYDLQRQAAEIIASGSDEWTQVGMNPYRGSGFYDKKTGKPVFEAEEIIQVGPLVLAKNVKKPTISQMKEMGVRTQDGKIRMFNEGGTAMNMQKQMSLFEYGGIADDGMKKDPVSGNDIPPGSLAKEVRDDIPAMLSEGEYVVPADVLRYYGVNFFEGLRNKAKQGLSSMEQNGRIGGEPIEANAGVLAMPDEYNLQSEALGGGQKFNPMDWSTVGGSLFQPQQPEAVSVTESKTFVNAENPSDVRVIQFVDGQPKPESDAQYTKPPYYEQGSSALKEAMKSFTPTSSNDDNNTPPPTPGEGVGMKDWGKDVDWSDPLAFANSVVEGVENKLGNKVLQGAAAIGGAGAMGILGGLQSVQGLQRISDLKAAAIIAKAQGMDDQATQIDKIINDQLKQSNDVVNFLDDLVATGTQKAKSVLDRMNLKYTRDSKTGKITINDEQKSMNLKIAKFWADKEKAKTQTPQERAADLDRIRNEDPNIVSSTTEFDDSGTSTTTTIYDPETTAGTLDPGLTTADEDGLYKGGLMTRKKK